jgi:DNA-binding MarR family transcriptional regulator
MKTIEEVLKQSKPFKSEKRRAILNIVVSGHQMVDALDDHLATFSLTQKQFNVLRIIKGAKKGVSTLYIKERMLVKNADASRIVDRLVKKGYLDKCPHEVDKRLVQVSLTKTGEGLIRKIDKTLDKLDELLNSLSEEESKTLNHLLNKIRS